jgi:hypothetical protein
MDIVRAHIGWDDDAVYDEEYNVDHVYVIDENNMAYDCRGRFNDEESLVGDCYQVNQTNLVDFSAEDIDDAIAAGKLKPYDIAMIKQAQSEWMVC